MRLSPRQRKWLKRFAILLLLRVVIGVVLYYIITYKFREVTQYVVQKESKGLYAFDAGSIDVHLFKGTLVLNHVSLRCMDTLHVPAHFAVDIPQVYLSIASFKDLVLHKRLSIDSMAIVQPRVMAHVHYESRTPRPSFQASQVLEAMQKMVLHLQVRSLRLKEGAFTYSTRQHPDVLESNHINFSVRNFSKKDRQQDYLFSAEDVDVSIANQYWKLSNGQVIAFKRLHFSGANQFFELDSAAYLTSKVNLMADKLFFKARRLQDIYENETLEVDTLLCYSPAIYLQTGTAPKDSTRAAKQLLKHIRFRYINIRDGQIAVNNQTSTQRTNLQIFNLAMRPDSVRGASTDSVKLELSSLRFMTKDSLYALTLQQFSLQQQDLIFTHATFGPTEYNHHSRGMRISTPLMRIRNINLPALLQKELRGSMVELHTPVIEVYDHDKHARKPAAVKDSSGGKLVHFYHTLHDLEELLEVDSFLMQHGRVHYQSARNGADILLRDINGPVLLEQFLRSDSLIDIKRSLPDLRIGQLRVRTPKLKIQVDQYRFQGFRRQNNAAHAVVQTPALQLDARQIHWDILDWDQIANNNVIMAEYLHLHRLDIQVSASTGKSTTQKPLPAIYAGRIDIDQLELHHPAVQLSGRDVCVDEIHSRGHHLAWDGLQGQFHNIDGSHLHIGSLSVNNDYVHSGTNTQVTAMDGHLQLNIPQWQLRAPLHSTDLSNVEAHTLSVAHAQVQYHQDSLVASGEISLHAADVRKSGTALHYKAAQVQLEALTLQSPKLQASLANGTIQLQDGSENTLRAQWQLQALMLHKTDSTLLSLQQLQGSYDASDLKQLNTAALNFNGDSLRYENHQSTASAANLRWNGPGNDLTIKTFAFRPRLSRDSAFAQAQYQADYITASGEQLQLQGLEMKPHLRVQQATVTSLALETARDKRMPFRHGIEKEMPGQLINQVKTPFTIDTLHIVQGLVTVKEISPRTGFEGAVPITDINGYLTHISNKHPGNDSLQLNASAVLGNAYIHHFLYSEAYGDTLSPFRLSVGISPMALPPLSSILMPMAAVQITNGYADTLYANWTGNKYAAMGNMNFYYRKLRIQMRDASDTSRIRFKQKVINFAANNFVLRKQNSRPSTTYFERDREKFVFNYWVKTTLRGLMSSVGVKKDKKYRKQYEAGKTRFSLGTATP